MTWGCQSMVGPIERLLLKHPRDAFVSERHLQERWQALGYTACPDYETALGEYDRFVALLERHATAIHYLPRTEDTGPDSIYVHDPVIVTSRGAILCSMGKDARRSEPAAAGSFLRQLGIAVAGAIDAGGLLEGGDVVWIDERTLAVGRGYRTNDEGIRQLKRLTADLVDEFVIVPLPHWDGPDRVLHLMSLLSPIDRDLAVVYSRLLPIPFREWLLGRGVSLVEVPHEEYDTLGGNILAVAPRRCLMLAGNPRTGARLRQAGAEVWEFEGAEVCHKGAGGPTCLTRPLLRSKAL